jgi:hypothetical protein
VIAFETLTFIFISKKPPKTIWFSKFNLSWAYLILSLQPSTAPPHKSDTFKGFPQNKFNVYFSPNLFSLSEIICANLINILLPVPYLNTTNIQSLIVYINEKKDKHWGSTSATTLTYDRVTRLGEFSPIGR